MTSAGTPMTIHIFSSFLCVSLKPSIWPKPYSKCPKKLFCITWLLIDVRPFDLQHWQSWTLWRYLNECNLTIMGSITHCYFPSCYYLLCECVKNAAISYHHLNNQRKDNSDKLRTEILSYFSKKNGAWIRACPHPGARFWPMTINLFWKCFI